MLQSKQLIQEQFRGCFKTKDKSKFEHQHDIIYQVKCWQKIFQTTILGELAKRVIKRVKDHGGRDTKSHVLKHNI